MGNLTDRTVRILLIDDEEAIRDSVRLALDDQNFLKFEIYEAENSEQGFELAKRIVPDTLVLDLHMPEKSGFDFMDLLNGEPSLDTTQVIMLTGDNTPANMFEADARRIKPSRFISKPFNVDELLSAVFGTVGMLRGKTDTPDNMPTLSPSGA